MNLKSVFLLSVILIGCGSNPESDDEDNRTATNMCITPGATYVAYYTQLDGNCGDQPTMVLNVSADGTTNDSSRSVKCEEYETTGCRQQNSNCKQTTAPGCEAVTNSDITIAEDGSEGGGVMSVYISCDDGRACASLYNIYYERQ